MMDDRKLTIAVWLVMAIISAIGVIASFTGAAPGVAPDRHPAEYLVVSNIAIFLLISVIPVLRLLRLAVMPWWFNLILIADVYFYVISLTMGFYLDPSIPWWGFLGHTCSSMAVGGICFLAMCLVSSSSNNVRFGGNAGLVFMLFFASLSFGGIWEVMESYIDIVSGQAYMSYGMMDSLQDLQADALGSLFICIIATVMLRYRTAEEIAAGTHLGRGRD